MCLAVAAGKAAGCRESPWLAVTKLYLTALVSLVLVICTVTNELHPAASNYDFHLT